MKQVMKFYVLFFISLVNQRSRIRDLAAALEAVQTEQLNLLSSMPPGQGEIDWMKDW